MGTTGGDGSAGRRPRARGDPRGARPDAGLDDLATSHPSLGPSALDDLRADFTSSGGLGPVETRALLDRMADIVEEILSIEPPAVELLSAAVKR